MAEVFDSTPHRSLLLRRLGRLGLGTPERLLDLAVLRGCSHYQRGQESEEVEDPGEAEVSNEQLAVALCSAAQVYNPHLIRCAVQLLSAPDVDFAALVHLARQERCLLFLITAAQAAQGDVEEVEGPWQSLLELPMAHGSRISSGRLPHASRFMVLPGRGRSGRMRSPRWLRRDPRPSAVAHETCPTPIQSGF